MTTDNSSFTTGEFVDSESATVGDRTSQSHGRDFTRLARTDEGQRSGKVLVVAIAALVGLVIAYFALGMPGMDHGSTNGSSMAGMDMGAPASPHRLVSADEFAILLKTAGTVMNVHVPPEGEISGTDLSMPYNALDAARLPADKSATMLIYCMTGNMSAEATATLIDLGYTDIVELAGGMEAWRESGRILSGS